MRAVLLPGDETAVVVDREMPVPGFGEVVVQVKASAICASDLSLYRGGALVGGEGAGKGAFVPGHEVAGVVSELGEGVRGVAVGQRVAIHLSIGCMTCEYCRSGYIHHCPDWRCLGFDLDGGDEEYVAVPAVNCLPLPAELSFGAGALLMDNLGTQYHTQKRLDVSGDGWTAIIGVGPMGAAAVSVAKARGAQVLAVDVVDRRLEMADRLGADVVMNGSSGDTLEQIMRLTNGRGFEVGIDCSGNAAGETLLLEGAAILGKVAFVGENASVTVNPSEQFIRKELTVIGGWVFPISDYAGLVRFVLSKHIDVEGAVSHRYSLEDADDAFRDFSRQRTDKVLFVMD